MTQSTESTSGVGILLITHGHFGVSLIEAAEFILGPMERRKAISVDVSKEVDETVETIKSAVEANDVGQGVLVLTDLFGGTPTTLSLSLLKSANLEVVTGVNLPMVVEAFQNRQLPLADLADRARDKGQQGIVVAGELLGRKKREAK